jgi:GNAT superfamily N-acetyltransferase
VDPQPFLLRPAAPDDILTLETLMRAAVRDIFPAFYDARQTASSATWIAVPDRTLIEDGTYFAVDGRDGIVACGGWSRRDKLFSGEAGQEGRARLLDPATEPARVRAMFVRPDHARRGLGTLILAACESAAREAGFRQLALMATMPGLALYERYGFTVVDRVTITLPDGVGVECAQMEMALR